MSFEALKADTIRKKGKYKLNYVISLYFSDRTFRPVATLRLCQATRKSKFIGKLFHYYFRWLHRMACNRAGIDLPWKTTVTGGLAITHGWGLVVNGNSVIGKNVTLFHGVTLGQRDKIDQEGKRFTEYPVIEDEVWIGPHAVIVGGVTIGKGSRIAGNSFVIESVPPYSTVAGNPATIVKSNSKPDVYNRVP
jgi:serine O-acetyltransferase